LRFPGQNDALEIAKIAVIPGKKPPWWDQEIYNQVRKGGAAA
jgi:hypothetical protein